MKKIAAIILMGCLAVSMLAGCGKKTSTSGSKYGVDVKQADDSVTINIDKGKDTPEGYSWKVYSTTEDVASASVEDKDKTLSVTITPLNEGYTSIVCQLVNDAIAADEVYEITQSVQVDSDKKITLMGDYTYRDLEGVKVAAEEEAYSITSKADNNGGITFLVAPAQEDEWDCTVSNEDKISANGSLTDEGVYEVECWFKDYAVENETLTLTNSAQNISYKITFTGIVDGIASYICEKE